MKAIAIEKALAAKGFEIARTGWKKTIRLSSIRLNAPTERRAEPRMRHIDLERLRYYMWKRGIKNKTALARATGLTRITINNLFSGKQPMYGTISLLIDALEIPEERVGEVFYAKEEPAGRTDSPERTIYA